MEQEFEQEFGDEGTTFGCALVYGVLLALVGLVLAAYALLGGVPAPIAGLVAGAGSTRAVLILLGLLAIAVGAGLWYGQTWAWGLVLLLHSLGALLGVAVALLPLFAGNLAGRPLAGLATPATALMGVVVNIVIVAWFWRHRNPGGEEDF